jgi:hypothetical protein
MKKVITVAALMLLMTTAGSAVATEPNKGQKKAQNAATNVKALSKKIVRIEALISQMQSPITFGRDGLSGTNGAAGKDGRDGINGKDGLAGKDGINGKDGAPGKDGLNGADGRDGAPGQNGLPGAGLPSGMIILINGSCPDGFVMQGAPNRWTVYANDTTGRPWTTTGSSAQLFLSACQVN